MSAGLRAAIMAVREFPPESQSFTLSPSLFYQETHCQSPKVLTQVLLQQPGEDRVSVGDEVALPLLVALLQRTEQQLASQSHTLMFPDHSLVSDVPFQPERRSPSPAW